MPGIWPFFTGIFIALTPGLAMVFGMHFYLDYQSKSSRRNSSEILNVELARSARVEVVASVTTDLMILDALFVRISYSSQ